MSLISGRVTLAAAKLALFYIGFVILEIVVLGFVLRLGLPSLHDTRDMAGMLSIPFAAAFLLLATARKWGFIALWTILGAFWIFVAVASNARAWPTLYPQVFFAWSILALPLWIMGQAGLPRTSTRRISGSMLMLVCWAVLLFGVRFFAKYQPPAFPGRQDGIANIIAWLWVPMPLILSTFAIRHVWHGTAKPVAA
ncbi:MAG TPA: hypothetical protein VJN70_01645 [Gemmatimonadaceae bacterium]|nr:hypothetical protein [Gemmatimonadaceae bacterium]